MKTPIILAAGAALAVVIGAGVFLMRGDAPPPETAQDGSQAMPGAEIFASQCTSCHVVKDPSGALLAGNRGRQGPNLYGMPHRAVADAEGYRYGASLKKAGEAGLVWDEANFTAYVQDPTGWLRDVLDDDSARSRMSWRVRDPEEATQLYAYLDALAEK